MDKFLNNNLPEQIKKKEKSSVQFSCSVMSDSLQPRGLQHTRPPCPSPTLEVTRTHVHRVSDAIQPSHPLSSTSPTTFNLSQHQGLFQWVSSSHQVAKGLEFQLQHQFLSLLLFKTLKKIKNLVIKIISGFYGFTGFFSIKCLKRKWKQNYRKSFRK